MTSFQYHVVLVTLAQPTTAELAVKLTYEEGTLGSRTIHPIDTLGEEGWELVTLFYQEIINQQTMKRETNLYAIFKREKLVERSE